jgi:hypothetical protein
VFVGESSLLRRGIRTADAGFCVSVFGGFEAVE